MECLRLQCLVKIAYIFTLRFNSETKDLKWADPNLSPQEILRQSDQSITNTIQGSKQVSVLRLRKRKNCQAFKATGYTIVRDCSCHGGSKFRHQMGKFFCPIHSLFEELIALDALSFGSPVAGDYKTSKALSDIRGAVSLNKEALGEPSGVGLHSFRRGAATEAAEAGMSEKDIRELGGWKSNASQVCLFYHTVLIIPNV